MTESKLLSRTVKIQLAFERWPSLLSFVECMVVKLDENSGKGGWSNDSPDSLLLRVFEEAVELTSAVKHETSDAVIREAADVANFAMMVADVVARRVNGKGIL